MPACSELRATGPIGGSRVRAPPAPEPAGSPCQDCLQERPPRPRTSRRPRRPGRPPHHADRLAPRAGRRRLAHDADHQRPHPVRLLKLTPAQRHDRMADSRTPRPGCRSRRSRCGHPSWPDPAMFSHQTLVIRNRIPAQRQARRSASPAPEGRSSFWPGPGCGGSTRARSGATKQSISGRFSPSLSQNADSLGISGRGSLCRHAPRPDAIVGSSSPCAAAVASRNTVVYQSLNGCGCSAEILLLSACEPGVARAHFSDEGSML
jgi:hypothetical protein